jgi:hypothetical protein
MDSGIVLTPDPNVIENSANDGTIIVKLGSANIFDFRNPPTLENITKRHPHLFLLIEERKDPNIQEKNMFQEIKESLVALGYDGFWFQSQHGRLCLVFKLSSVESVQDYKVSDYTTVATELGFSTVFNHQKKQITDKSSLANFFNYYKVSDDEISDHLKSKDLESLDIKNGWNHADKNMTPSSVEKNIHVMRIAKLVNEIKQSGFNNPVELKFNDYSKSLMVVDGHHRLRALIYLNFHSFPAIITGSKKTINKLLDEN